MSGDIRSLRPFMTDGVEDHGDVVSTRFEVMLIVKHTPPDHRAYRRITGDVYVRLRFDGDFEEYAQLQPDAQEKACAHWQQQLQQKLGFRAAIHGVEEGSVELLSLLPVGVAALLWRDQLQLSLAAPQAAAGSAELATVGAEEMPLLEVSPPHGRGGPLDLLLESVAYADDGAVLVREDRPVEWQRLQLRADDELMHQVPEKAYLLAPQHLAKLLCAPADSKAMSLLEAPSRPLLVSPRSSASDSAAAPSEAPARIAASASAQPSQSESAAVFEVGRYDASEWQLGMPLSFSE